MLPKIQNGFIWEMPETVVELMQELNKKSEFDSSLKKVKEFRKKIKNESGCYKCNEFCKSNVLQSRIKEMVAIHILLRDAKIEEIVRVFMIDNMNVPRISKEIITEICKAEIRTEIITCRCEINGITIMVDEVREKLVFILAAGMSREVEFQSQGIKPCIPLNSLTLRPVEVPKELNDLDDVVVETRVDKGAQRNFVSKFIVNKYFRYNKLQEVDVNVFVAGSQENEIDDAVQFKVEIC